MQLYRSVAEYEDEIERLNQIVDQLLGDVRKAYAEVDALRAQLAEATAKREAAGSHNEE